MNCDEHVKVYRIFCFFVLIGYDHENAVRETIEDTFEFELKDYPQFNPLKQ